MPIAFRARSTVAAGAELVAVPAAAADAGFLAAVGFEDDPGRAQFVPGRDGRPLVALGLGGGSAEDHRRAGAALAAAAWAARRVAVRLPAGAPAGAFAEGVALAAYRYRGRPAGPRASRLAEVDVVVPRGARRLQGELDRAAAVAAATAWARDLANEPGGSLTPARLADEAAAMAARRGLAAEVLDEAALARLGLGALLGVGQGSAQPARLVRLAYEPAARPVATLALVGKGVTFDSGGLSLKPADAMVAMKTDMAGAAAVLGALSVLPALAPPVRVLGLVPMAENMPGGRSLKPGDVVRARNGTTIEVLNTDAEGRLLLADALALAAEAEPDAIVDVATLTGAQRVALGAKVAGLMGTHDGLVAQVRAAAERAGEPAWPLPLPAAYRSQLDSTVADLKNIGEPGQAGALVAGLFLAEFTGGRPWAHLDIAGPARADRTDGYVVQGATGWGVRTLVELVTAFEPLGPDPRSR